MSLDFTIPELHIGNAGTPPIQFYKQGLKIGGSGTTPTYQDIVLSGNGSLSLTNAKANGLNYLKLFGGTEQLPEQYLDSVTLDGGCEQNGTPTPTVPVDIVCNNGAIKCSANLCDVNADNIVVGKYISAQGVLSDSESNFTYIKYIPVKPNTTYTLSFSSPVYFSSVSEYSSAGDAGFVVRQTKYSTSLDAPFDLTEFTFTTGATTNYIRWGSNMYKSQALNIDNVLALNYMLVQGSAQPYRPYGQIYTDGTVEAVTDSVGNVATAEMLLSVGDYKDTQEVISGAVTRNIGIKVLDGTENWDQTTSYNNPYVFYTIMPDGKSGTGTLEVVWCSHFKGVAETNPNMPAESAKITVQGNSPNVSRLYFKTSIASTPELLSQWLADQYAQGTPVIIVYPLETATTETVTGQLLTKAPVTYSGSVSGLTGTTVTSSHTVPTPTNPLDINCNNGVVKVYKNLFDRNDPTTIINAYVGSSSVGDLAGIISSTNDRSFIIKTKPNTKYTIQKLGGEAPYNRFRISESSSFPQIGQRVTKLYEDTATTSGLRTTTVTTRNSGNYIIVYGLNGSPGTELPTFLDNFVVCEGETINAGQIYTDGTVETVEVYGNNLIDLSAVTDSYYYDAQGNYTAFSTSRTTDYIPIETGKDVRIYFKSLSSTTYLNVRINIFNSNKVWQSQEVLRLEPNADGTMTVTPTYNGYIRVSGNYSGGAIVDWNTASITKSLGSATAEMLLKVNTYQDVQSVLDGEVTRNVGITILDGSENWQKSGTYTGSFFVNSYIPLDGTKVDTVPSVYCTHAVNTTNLTEYAAAAPGAIYWYSSGTMNFKYDDGTTSATTFKQWLADEYQAGHPVTIIYPLATATTETVTGQPLTIQAGTNVVEITQASIDNLELEVSYKGKEGE